MVEGVHCGTSPGCGGCGIVSFGAPLLYGDGTAPGCGGGGLAEVLMVVVGAVTVGVG